MAAPDPIAAPQPRREFLRKRRAGSSQSERESSSSPRAGQPAKIKPAKRRHASQTRQQPNSGNPVQVPQTAVEPRVEAVPDRIRSLSPPLGISETVLFSSKKKWWMLTVVALCELFANSYVAFYPNSTSRAGKNHSELEKAEWSLVFYLAASALGRICLAPVSDGLGRRLAVQLALITVNFGNIAVFFGGTTSLPLIGAITGFASALNAVGPGVVADLFSAYEQQEALLYAASLASSGPYLGLICGFLLRNVISTHQYFGIQVTIGCLLQLLHFVTVDETYPIIAADIDARKRRKRGEIVPGLFRGRPWYRQMDLIE
ncbi:hypothetical protein M011DRAFT_215545 [Sporormia fimetaria CBS 119925]|uniref:MFS general substrate transporter n=1 Tax=Sporormia fimetaria CBS 119925 TaxID=1340428 RepID=A0A6A6UZF6_9PLEO|nr:hypothetical protein M011DRAFT_215545 [Sporormia fimetaria CBS 119925]